MLAGALLMDQLEAPAPTAPGSSPAARLTSTILEPAVDFVVYDTESVTGKSLDALRRSTRRLKVRMFDHAWAIQVILEGKFPDDMCLGLSKGSPNKQYQISKSLSTAGSGGADDESVELPESPVFATGTAGQADTPFSTPNVFVADSASDDDRSLRNNSLPATPQDSNGRKQSGDRSVGQYVVSQAKLTTSQQQCRHQQPQQQHEGRSHPGASNTASPQQPAQAQLSSYVPSDLVRQPGKQQKPGGATPITSPETAATPQHGIIPSPSNPVSSSRTSTLKLQGTLSPRLHLRSELLLGRPPPRQHAVVPATSTHVEQQLVGLAAAQRQQQHQQADDSVSLPPESPVAAVTHVCAAAATNAPSTTGQGIPCSPVAAPAGQQRQEELAVTIKWHGDVVAESGRATAASARGHRAQYTGFVIVSKGGAQQDVTVGEHVVLQVRADNSSFAYD